MEILLIAWFIVEIGGAILLLMIAAALIKWIISAISFTWYSYRRSVEIANETYLEWRERLARDRARRRSAPDGAQ